MMFCNVGRICGARQSINGGVIGNFQNLPIADELSQYLHYLIKHPEITNSTLTNFGGSIESTSKNTDITLNTNNPKYIELKSLKQGSDGLDDENKGDVLSGLNLNPLKNRPQFVSQFIDGYLKTIENINELNYVFDARKLINNDVTFIKTQFKDLFTTKKTEIFNAMSPQLKVSLFKTSDESMYESIFNSLINNTNSDLYKFIKVE